MNSSCSCVPLCLCVLLLLGSLSDPPGDLRSLVGLLALKDHSFTKLNRKPAERCPAQGHLQTAFGDVY
uniref:Putative secreted protein n=1 Tax=Anopheles darlingi TaxID=43151 RepID=A0A2M4DNE5_ANODA